MPKSSADVDDPLCELASESLEAFEKIAEAATRWLGQRSPGADSFAAINGLTGVKTLSSFYAGQSELRTAYARLRDEPAIARIVIADEQDRRETLFISRAARVDCDVPLCSNLTPKGRLASLPVGESAPIRLPGGDTVFYEVLEKAVFRPIALAHGWDARDTIYRALGSGPLTIASLRDLLARSGVTEDDLDAFERQLAEEDEAELLFRGLRRDVLTAMQLRDQPILDQFQDRIFRLPIDSRLMILGPPGTGKTTTLVRRLRQKIDWAFLEDDERALVDAAAESGVAHAQSWLMFTPTELLKQYVKDAFAREGVPAPEQRIRTWEDHRRELARRSLPILRSASGGTMVWSDRTDVLLPDTITDQIAWFEDFDACQRLRFIDDLAAQAAALRDAKDGAVARIGTRVASLLASAREESVAVLSAIAAISDELRDVAGRLSEQVRDALRRPLAQRARRDAGLLDDLARYLTTLSADVEDDGDDLEIEDEEDVAIPLQGRRAAEASFVRALRAQSIAEARRRPLPHASRHAVVLDWAHERGIELPNMAGTGELVIVQRAVRRILAAPRDLVRNIPSRYRAFRRQCIGDGRWYTASAPVGTAITAIEVDLVLLTMLRGARAMLDGTNLIRRLGDRAPDILADVTRLQRNQILVDEATDFSPVQLACMAALASPWTDSFFACGDFNQRLTSWGTRSTEQVAWVFRDMQIETIEVAYRQSRKLTALAAMLKSADRTASPAHLPEHLEHEGVAPVFGPKLDDDASLAAWLAARIGEIEDFTGQLPSIAVLVNNAAQLRTLASALGEALSSRSIRVVSCPDGQVMGQANDVRVFDVEHIKGLEFEAVFFVGVDVLAERQPDLFDKYLYVGATRAATYLGITASGPALPARAEHVAHLFGTNW